MAVYDGAATVERAIASVLSQTFRDLELVVVDDGSRDGTGEVLKRIASSDPRVNVVTNSVNLGNPASSNRGIVAARSRLIARLDADDICLPDRLERQVERLVQEPDIGVLGGSAELVDNRGSLGVEHRPEGHEELTANMYRRTPFINSTVMMRREVLEAVGGYDERLPPPALNKAQDADLWFRLASLTRFANLPGSPLIRYSVRRRLGRAAAFGGGYVILQAGLREGRPVRGAVGAARFVATGLVGVRSLHRGR